MEPSGLSFKSKKMQSKGLGDTIDKITTATGIKKVVKAVAKEDCGCEGRRKKLNELFPYKNKSNGISKTTGIQGRSRY